MTDQSVPRYSARESILKHEMLIIAAGIVLVLGSAYAAWYLIFRQNAPDAVFANLLKRTGRAGSPTSRVSWPNPGTRK